MHGRSELQEAKHRRAHRIPGSDAGGGGQAPRRLRSAIKSGGKFFRTRNCRKLIRSALRQNYDVRIAATHILQAQAQVGLARANQLPNVNVTGSGTSLRNPSEGPIPSYTFNYGRVTANAAWDLDFWGKYRRATQAARANLLAADWAREEVDATLVSNVAAGYFQLRELDLELDISQKALASRKESLDLTKTLEEHGINSILDVRQAEQLVYTAGANIADVRRRIGQEEDALSVLLGNNPGAIARGKELIDQPHAPTVPPGLPSALLERRPDIRQAEELLVAANAQIGVARAALFSGYFADRAARISQLVSHEPLQRVCGAVDLCRNDHAASL